LKEPGRKIQLTPYDDLFQTTDPNKSEPAGTIEMLPLDQLHPFPDHPFKLYSEDRMLEMTESVRQSGVLTPILVRPVKDGDGFEIISGHNRVEAAKRADLSEVPGTIREMDNETAIIAMIDSNLRQREKLQPSEKAFAYKMKLDAMGRRAGRPSENNCAQVDHNYSGKKTRDIIAEQTGESGPQIQRFIRLTELIPPLLDMVDENKLAFNPAVAISYLNVEQQCWLMEIMEKEECSPSLTQADHLKQLAQLGKLDYPVLETVMSEPKPQQTQITLKQDRIAKFFPKDASPQQMEETILKLLENWYRKRNQEQSSPGR